MRPLPRDVLLMRIKLLHHQYAEQLLPNDHTRLRRFAAAAERLRAQTAEDDMDFVNQHLCRTMVSLGLIAREHPGCPGPGPVSRNRSNVDSPPHAAVIT